MDRKQTQMGRPIIIHIVCRDLMSEKIKGLFITAPPLHINFKKDISYIINCMSFITY